MRSKQGAGGKKRIAAGFAALAVLFSAVLLFGYSTFQDNLGTLQTPLPVVPRWNNVPATPVSWLLNAATPSNNVTGCSGSLATCIQQSVTAGFTTWTSAQIPIGNTQQTLTDVAVQYAGSSTLTTPNYQDCQNVVGFSDTTSGDFATGTIAFTEVATVTHPPGTPIPFQYSCSGGASKTCSLDDCMADADIEFNPNVQFTTSSTVPASTFSLQSVATHEEGHLLGLDHSGIGHTVMFPFGDTTAAGQQTQLSTDDAIGISFLYPSTNFGTATGVISGKVSLSGSGIFAAHVIAVNTVTGIAVTDGLTAPDGTYTLTGVPPGNYSVLALPLAPNSDSGVLNLDNFSGWECGYADSACTTVPTNPTSYTGRYH
jgi:Matrixin